jgi:hypothetical protein
LPTRRRRSKRPSREGRWIFVIRTTRRVEEWEGREGAGGGVAPPTTTDGRGAGWGGMAAQWARCGEDAAIASPHRQIVANMNVAPI